MRFKYGLLDEIGKPQIAVCVVYQQRTATIIQPDAKWFFKGSPDLAVKVFSPSDTVEGVHGKIVEYFENDTKLAWEVNPEEQTVTVYRSSYPHKLLTN